MLERREGRGIGTYHADVIPIQQDLGEFCLGSGIITFTSKVREVCEDEEGRGGSGQGRKEAYNSTTSSRTMFT